MLEKIKNQEVKFTRVNLIEKTLNLSAKISEKLTNVEKSPIRKVETKDIEPV